jgi:hypothetical protein
VESSVVPTLKAHRFSRAPHTLGINRLCDKAISEDNELISTTFRLSNEWWRFMGWRFRQSFTIIPGLRLNLSKNGLSASIGGAPFTLNVGPREVISTVSIPGTGLSYREHFNSGHSTPPDDDSPNLHPMSHRGPTAPVYVAPIEEIHSASTELLTSETLKEIKKFIQTAHQQHEEITRELDKARTAKVGSEGRFRSWENGFLFRRLFKKAFAKRKEIFETETAKVEELEEQLRLSMIVTQIEIDHEQSELYYRLRDEFAALCECAAIWDIKSRQATDMFHERTTAGMKLLRENIRFALGVVTC